MGLWRLICSVWMKGDNLDQGGLRSGGEVSRRVRA